MEQLFDTTRKLKDAIKNMQTSLQCTICLHTISQPVKTPCGHRFCRTCIQTVLQNKSALCPLCNTPIQRRSITVDEDMKVYIDRLQDLIEAVEKDSGINIHPHLDRSLEESFKCNSNVVTIKDRDDTPPSTPRKKRESKKQDSGNSDIRDYLTKYSMSGVEPLSSDTARNQNEDVDDKNSKVHSWLNTLPSSEALVDPDKIVPEELVDCNLDDTLTVSVSQNCKDNKLSDYEVEGVQQLQSPLRALPNNAKGDETGSDGSKTVILEDPDNPRPSTSGITRHKEEYKERNDVQRTSPSDMLPAMKKNWSSVARFGKEMRTKKKKLKSLNVSKSRSYEEAGEEGKGRNERREKESNVSLGVSKLARDRLMSKEKDSLRCESRKDPEASTNIARSIDDRRNLTNVQERRKSLEKSMNRNERRSYTPANDVSKRCNLNESSTENSRVKPAENSDEVQILGETSFIELERGEQVRIKKLNNRQMNDIIGVSENVDPPMTIDNDATDNRNQMDNSLPLKKRRNLSSTPPGDRSEMPDQTTPTKLPADKHDQSLCDTTNDSASKCQSAKSRGRLSLARHNMEPKPNDSSSSDYISRLQAAKRDLNLQMDASVDVYNAANSFGDKDETMENVRRVRPTSSKMKDIGDVSMVKFKKLGKVFKHRKKRVRFFYLGSTRPRKYVGSNYPEFKPCNLVDYWDTQCFAVSDSLENAFGNNLLINVNNSSLDKHEDVQKAQSLPKAKDTEDVVCLDMEKKDNVAESMDVVFVSLDEDGKEEATKAPENSMPKSPVHLKSPSNVSQMRYLPFESPSNCVTKTSKYSHAESVVISNQKDFEVKGAHSRALIRRSQQASASSDTDSTCDSASKRKRPKETGWIDKNILRMRNMSLVNEAGYDSDHSFSSRTTCIRNSDKGTGSSKNENVPLSKTSARCVDTMSVSSDSDGDIGRNVKQKKHRKILPVVSSDTESPNFVCLNKELQSPPSKRKRIQSPPSQEVDLRTIVKNWCDDPNMDRNTNKPNQPSVPNRQEGYRRPAESCSFNFSAGNKSQPRQVSNAASNLVSQEPSRVVQMDQDSPDFAATIDRIQYIRNNAATPRNEEIVQKVDPEEVMMIENLNDDLDFDTNAFDECLEAQGIKPAKRVEDNEPTGSSSFRPLNKDVMLAHRSNGSDKNKYKGGRLSQIVSDNEVTFIDDFDQVAERIEGVKPSEPHGDKSRRNSEVDKSSRRNAMTSNNEKHADGLQRRANDDALMKDADYEQDSLMDITQHELQIKHFEADVFGRPLFEFKGQEKTPQKNKDNEHSAEEDDIVENTPDTKTKNAHLNAYRETTAASSTTNINDKHLRTPSSVTGRSTIASTPCSKRSLHPLYQSTPKSQQPSKKASSIKQTTKNESLRRLRDQTTNNCDKPRLCFVCSGLVVVQVNQVKRLAQLVNARYLTQFDEQVTHVIVRVDDENNGANKTLKYLQGIAHRKWIVGYQWVVDSLKEKKLVDEERYEAVDCGTLEAGPRNSRLRKRDLFEGFVFLCIGPYVDVSVDQYRDLLRATGARVVDSLDALTGEKSKLKIIVIQSDVHDYEIIVEWYQKARAVPIVHDWVVECISQYRLISFYPYLQELSRQDVLALGYPEFLVEEELDADSDSACNLST
nr:PREDICTED: breast cancer type 1 susceptibility protein homolog isoform X1 [Megachile rotundata]